MSVELRCPDCRAKLRLGKAPDPGTEVECPECNAIFPAPDPDTGEVPDARGKRQAAKKKKTRVRDEDDAPEAEKPKATEKKPVGDKKAPRMRKAKKKETNKGALVLVVVLGVLFLGLFIGLLAWYFTRKPASYEMMNYLPEDAIQATGLNIGHMQKYSEFIKVVEPTYKDLGFQKAINVLAPALGYKEASELPDYMVEGWGPSGQGLVIRSKKVFDPADLKKVPGAQSGSLSGQEYFRISPIPKLWGGIAVKVFAPTNRLIVVCPDNTAEATFKQMISGNKDSKDTLPARLGPLGKRTTRGTFWVIAVLNATTRPVKPKDNAANPTSGAFLTQAATQSESGQGYGFKASLGSRAVRFEVVLWCKDSETASEGYKKYKESDLIKAQDDASADPPRWWKDMGETYLGGKKIANELLSNLGAKSSGELFIIYSECDTKILMEGITSLIVRITGQNQNTMGGGGGAGLGPPPVGGGLGPPPGGGGLGPPPGGGSLGPTP